MSALLPDTKEDAIKASVDAMLLAAKLLLVAIDVAEEGTEVSYWLMVIDKLGDFATCLRPPQHSWPEGGAKLYDFASRKQVN